MGRTEDARENTQNSANTNGASNGSESNAELLMNIISELLKHSGDELERRGINVQVKCPYCGNEVTLQITVRL